MATKTIERELIELEKQFWQALKEGDIETVVRLSDDPCIVAGASGVASIDANTMRRMIESANYAIRRFEVDGDVMVRQLSNDIAILAYKVHEDLTVDGQPVSLDASDTSVWKRRDGRWVCSLHTESILGDAFGRDRKPM